MSSKLKIRIAVAIDHLGNWNASGWGFKGIPNDPQECMDLAIDTLASGERRYWVDVEIEKPVVEIIEAVAEPLP